MGYNFSTAPVCLWSAFLHGTVTEQGSWQLISGPKYIALVLLCLSMPFLLCMYFR